jgi:hypothetical protein
LQLEAGPEISLTITLTVFFFFLWCRQWDGSVDAQDGGAVPAVIPVVEADLEVSQVTVQLGDEDSGEVSDLDSISSLGTII